MRLLSSWIHVSVLSTIVWFWCYPGSRHDGVTCGLICGTSNQHADNKLVRMLSAVQCTDMFIVVTLNGDWLCQSNAQQGTLMPKQWCSCLLYMQSVCCWGEACLAVTNWLLCVSTLHCSGCLRSRARSMRRCCLTGV